MPVHARGRTLAFRHHAPGAGLNAGGCGLDHSDYRKRRQAANPEWGPGWEKCRLLAFSLAGASPGGASSTSGSLAKRQLRPQYRWSSAHRRASRLAWNSLAVGLMGQGLRHPSAGVAGAGG